LVRIFITFKKCHLQIENLEKLLFVNKNWLNDLRIRCNSICLNTILWKDIDLEKEFEEFEGGFERDEVVEGYKFNKFFVTFNNFFVTLLVFFIIKNE